MTFVTLPVLPWRKVFPRDRRNDPRRWTLTLEQRGALEELLDAAWLAGGELPADDAVLAQLSCAGPRWIEIRAPIMAAFFQLEGTVYVSPALAAQAAEAQHFIAEQKRKSALATEARKARASPAGPPVDEPAVPPADAPGGSPPFSRQPSVVSLQTRTPLRGETGTATEHAPRAPRRGGASAAGNGNAALWKAITGAEGVKVSKTKDGRPDARLVCPACEAGIAHVTREPDGRLLAKCFGGDGAPSDCDAPAIVNALGFPASALFPDRMGGPGQVLS